MKNVVLSLTDPRAPRFWQYETTGVLRPVVEAYLNGKELDAAAVLVMRAYLRQWIQSPVWHGGDELERLRTSLETIRNRRDISAWLYDALEEGLDPL